MSNFIEDYNVITGPMGIGSSVVKVHTGRDLTAGEIAMCQKIFGGSIKYGKVKVHPHGAYSERNVDGNAVTPNGQIYFNSEDYRPDFSAESVSKQSWFIHEMTHVWQHQKGFPVRSAGLKLHVWDRMYNGAYPYAYWVTDLDCQFNDYNFEAQGRLIEDYYALIIKSDPNAMSNHGYKYIYDSSTFHDQKKRNLKRIVDEFIASPKDGNQLPKDTFGLGKFITKNYGA
jgi:type VI secretion system secreted protein VgrG